ncbi:MAG: RnfABCDGE type electron transport complex subunit B [Phycisphaerales bacterium]|nr:RnfABCDGE type electron transport complex subunit B [Phycisphaerales bacterium]
MLLTVAMAAVILFALTLVFATLLGIAKDKLRVDEDPRIAEVNEALPAANCGGCGFAGCADFAKAVVEQRVACSGCPVGGSETATRIAEILGVEVIETAPYRVVIKCGARTEDKLGGVQYDGVRSCVEANVVGTTQACVYGCLGYGDCCTACDFDALHMQAGRPVVDYDKCTGCGACVTACPRDLIERIPFKQERMLVVACNNHEPAKAVKAVCKVGCIGCKMCERLAKGIFVVTDNVAHIDYETYTGAETPEIQKVLDKCPAEVLVYFGKPRPEQAEPEAVTEGASAEREAEA